MELWLNEININLSYVFPDEQVFTKTHIGSCMDSAWRMLIKI